MPSPRRKNTATADDIVHLLMAGLPEGLGKEVQFSDENEVFAEQKELLLRELLLTTPRPTLKLLTSAAELAFQDGDKGVIENFSKRVVSTSQFLFQKLQQSSSMKKLKPAVRRLIQILRPGPQGSMPAGAPRVTVKAGKFLRKNCAARRLGKHNSEQSAAAAAGSSKDHLQALAASYGLKSVPASAVNALGPCMVSDSDEDDSDCFVVSDELEASSEEPSAEPSDVQRKPAASTVAPVAMASGKQPVKSHENFDLNRCCWVRHVQGKVEEAYMRPGPNGFMLATFKGEAEKEVEVATVLWRKSLDSKPKAKAKGTSKAKAKAETAKSKKAAKKRAAKKPPVAAPAEEPEEEEEEDDEIAEEPLVRKKPACIIRRARGHGSTAASLKRPAAAPADGEDSDDHPHRFAYMWYKNEAIGLCKYWRSRKSTGIKRKQLTNFRQKGWNEDRLRKAGEACVQALANETIAANKEEIDAFMARYVQEQEG